MKKNNILYVCNKNNSIHMVSENLVRLSVKYSAHIFYIFETQRQKTCNTEGSKLQVSIKYGNKLAKQQKYTYANRSCASRLVMNFLPQLRRKLERWRRSVSKQVNAVNEQLVTTDSFNVQCVTNRLSTKHLIPYRISTNESMVAFFFKIWQI